MFTPVSLLRRPECLGFPAEVVHCATQTPNVLDSLSLYRRIRRMPDVEVKITVLGRLFAFRAAPIAGFSRLQINVERLAKVLIRKPHLFSPGCAHGEFRAH